MSSIREMSWLKSNSVLVMGDLFEASTKDKPLAISPRNILKKQIDELRKLGKYSF
jgi:glutamine synthetase